MPASQITPESIFQHHLEALGKNDLDELMKDYTEESELWTLQDTIVGLKAISIFYSYAFTLFPKDNTRLEIKKLIAKGNKVYLVWIADSPIVNVSFATDCFEIKDGKILWQSTAFQMVQK
ncbi:MAG: nuclear transport factor 2 family protein [Segetibacter sp.]